MVWDYDKLSMSIDGGVSSYYNWIELLAVEVIVKKKDVLEFKKVHVMGKSLS